MLTNMSVFVCSFRYSARKALTSFYFVICGLSGTPIFFYVISQTVWFSGKMNLKYMLLVFSTHFFLKQF